MPSFRFASATGSGSSLIVTCSDLFAGKTITCTNGTKTYTRTCPSTSPYEVVFKGVAPGTWTVSGVVEGQTYSQQVVITDFDVILTAGFDYKQWVTLGGLDPTDYTDLEDVFADEAAVRRLMTIHASADYLIEKITDDIDIIDDFTANDTAMKWIGHRDYICDGLTAIAGVEAKFLASQYWERYLKDHVPTMTSNTAPYGEAFASNSYTSFDPYKAFDKLNGDSKRWVTTNTSNQYLGYKFTNPICVKAFAITNRSGSGTGNRSPYHVKLQYNDNGTWTDATDTLENSSEVEHTTLFNISTNHTSKEWRLFIADNHGASEINVGELQFYGRSLNVSVPVMTSDTAPYGEVIYSSKTSDKFGYYAFSGSTSNYWASNTQETGSGPYIGYKFIKPNKIKEVSGWLTLSGTSTTNTIVVQASDDGNNWVDISNESDVYTTSNAAYFNIPCTPDKEYTYYRLFKVSSTITARFWANRLNFYGVDYTEREFAEGSTMKYLYDHGVELETINTTGAVTKDDDYITLSAANAQASHTLDLTPYDLLRGKVGDHMSGTTALIAGTTATANMTAANAPNNESLDVSSVNASLATGAKMTGAGVCDIKELWLE